jgi:hypothetical protein
MPKVPVNAQVQRHFPPLLYRSRFSPERLLTPPPLVLRKQYPAETRSPSPFIISTSGSEIGGSSGDETSSKPSKGKACLVPEPSGEVAHLIPKPAGEVARPGRRGYTLRRVLGWDDSTYKKVKACFAFIVSTVLNSHFKL